MIQFLAETRKAVAAAVLQGSGAYAALKLSGANIDPSVELIAAIVAGLVAGIAVYFTPNAAPAAPVAPPAAKPAA